MRLMYSKEVFDSSPPCDGIYNFRSLHVLDALFFTFDVLRITGYLY